MSLTCISASTKVPPSPNASVVVVVSLSLSFQINLDPPPRALELPPRRRPPTSSRAHREPPHCAHTSLPMPALPCRFRLVRRCRWGR